MKLYEVIEQTPTRRHQFFTRKSDAMGIYHGTVKILKAVHGIIHQSVTVNAIEVRTNITAAEWCDLLTADAPGPICEVTPVDFITNRTQLRRWEGVTP